MIRGDGNVGRAVESRRVGGDDGPACCSCRGGDYEVLGAARPAGSLTSSPSPRARGSMRAMALPRRTTVNRSPRCSTASSTSAKPRAASVALISVTESDYLML